MGTLSKSTCHQRCQSIWPLISHRLLHSKWTCGFSLKFCLALMSVVYFNECVDFDQKKIKGRLNKLKIPIEIMFTKIMNKKDKENKQLPILFSRKYYTLIKKQVKCSCLVISLALKCFTRSIALLLLMTETTELWL